MGSLDRFAVKWRFEVHYSNQDFWELPIVFSNRPKTWFLPMNLDAALMLAIL